MFFISSCVSLLGLPGPFQKENVFSHISKSTKSKNVLTRWAFSKRDLIECLNEKSPELSLAIEYLASSSWHSLGRFRRCCLVERCMPLQRVFGVLKYQATLSCDSLHAPHSRCSLPGFLNLLQYLSHVTMPQLYHNRPLFLLMPKSK